MNASPNRHRVFCARRIRKARESNIGMRGMGAGTGKANQVSRQPLFRGVQDNPGRKESRAGLGGHFRHGVIFHIYRSYRFNRGSRVNRGILV